MALLRLLSACSWLFLGLWLGCADDASRRDLGGGADGSTTGGGSLGSGVGGDGDGSSGRAEGAGPLPDPAVPAVPCGDDLDVHNGTAVVDVGALRKGKAFPAADPHDAGPFEVLEIDAKVKNPDPSLGDIAVTLYLPSEDGAHVAAGEHPLVMVMPGYGRGFGVLLSGTHPTYAFYSRHFASYGLLTVGMSFVAGGFGIQGLGTPQLGAHLLTSQEKNVAEVRAVLDWVLAESEARTAIDPTKVAIAGHSQGGKIGFFTAAEDSRIDFVIGWDAQNAAGGSPCGVPGGEACDALSIAPNCRADDPGRMHELHAETLVFAARDAATMPDTHQWAEHFYRGAPSPSHLLLFPSAGHEDWAADDNPVAALTMRVQLSFLLSRFMGTTGLEAWLAGADALTAQVPDVERFDK